MSLKDWFSSKSYRQATGKHFSNTSPYIKETLIGTAAVAGGCTLVGYNWFKKPASYSQSNYQKWKWNISSAIPDEVNYEEEQLNLLSLDERSVLYVYGFTKHLVVPSIALPFIANTGIQIFKVTYCDDKGLSVESFSTGLSESWKQTCDAAYGAKEMAHCAGNAVGYLGTLIAVDGIYDHVVMPCAGDVLHIH